MPHVLIATLRLVRAVVLGAVRQSVGRGRAHVVSVGIEYISNVHTLRRAKIRCEASFGTYRHTYSTLRAQSQASQTCIVGAPPTPPTAPPQRPATARPPPSRAAPVPCTLSSYHNLPRRDKLVRARSGRPSMADHCGPALQSQATWRGCAAVACPGRRLRRADLRAYESRRNSPHRKAARSARDRPGGHGRAHGEG